MTSQEHSSKALEFIAKNFKKNVQIMDRRYHLKTYKDCFVASEAVDYLVQSGAAATREEAVRMGRALQSSFVFEHVTRDHEFADEYLFFRFLDGERGEFKMCPSTGAKLDWGHYLAPPAHASEKEHSPWQTRFGTPDLELLDPKDVHVASHLWPMDEHNTVLLNHVHPPEWQDPIADTASDNKVSYDLVVIGGGAGGLISASGSAGVGAKVALIEANMLGGDCLNVGCVPSKALIHSANLAHQLRGDTARLQAAGIFVDPSAVKVDFDKVMERIRKVRADISHHDSAARYSKELGVEVYIGRGSFTSDRTVSVNGRTLHFKRAVIATGGSPTLIPMEGLQELYYQSTSAKSDSDRPAVMTNETFFNLTQQPKHLVVIGPGAIGMELAQAMQRLGTPTTVLGRSGRILPKEDEDMANIVKDQMIEDGVTFRLCVEAYHSIELTGSISGSGMPEMRLAIQEKGEAQPSIILCDAVLVATGRRPNVTGMDLELANVEYDTTKGIHVNDKLQTTNPRVYGVGDCALPYKFTHAADFSARAVVRNAFFFGKEKLSDMLIPYATFTSPEIASVGLYGADLDEKGIEYRVFESHFKNNDRAILDEATTGFIRFRVDAKKDTILGASIVGNDAGNMISEVTLAMKSGTGLASLANVIHPYPTTGEAIRRAGDHFNKTKLTMTAKALLRNVVHWQS
eukprot:Nitzschia sp. Nitz4//scaffold65_size103378//22017//24157//NITZ4_004458-RA/size103378-augustus-gene-0.78-mRNA-1//1//CDS//3329556216//1309//frame0